MKFEIGACRYCGQTYQIECKDNEKLTVDEIATNLCNCDEAQEERRLYKRRIMAAENIDKMFGEGPDVEKSEEE